jgi:hypothetical protein
MPNHSTEVADAARPALPILLRCSVETERKARYVLDSLLQSAGVPSVYVGQPPAAGPWLLYGPVKPNDDPAGRCLAIAHLPDAWRLFDGQADVESATSIEGVPTVFSQRAAGFDALSDIGFDIVANAFYFLSSWSERCGPEPAPTRRLYANSHFKRLAVPQDVVDRYMSLLIDRIGALCRRIGFDPWPPLAWPGGAGHALVLSHDVDFLPAGRREIAWQGAKTVLRHLVRQRDPGDAWQSLQGWVRAWRQDRDPYGCVPDIIAREKELGVKSSFQVAVGHRHRDDVNYRIEDDRVRDYLRAIPDAGFDLCLHGSYRSTEKAQWYVDEVALLTQRLVRPLGSRQHFLSFDYDTLFAAQERAGIAFDMSLGYPDHTGPRAGFSFPYFPYNLQEDRPYDVLQISLFLMDVTLRSYMRLKGKAAWRAIESCLEDVRAKRGCASAVWHPIVFGGARDPGFDDLYWTMVRHVGATGGLATDGRTINDFWRAHARAMRQGRELASSKENQQ